MPKNTLHSPTKLSIHTSLAIGMNVYNDLLMLDINEGSVQKRSVSEVSLKPKAGNSGDRTIHLSVAVGVFVPSCLPVPQVPTSTSDGEKNASLGQPILSPAYSGVLERVFRAV